MKKFYFVILFAFIGFTKVKAQNALDFDGVDDYVQTTAQGVLGGASRTVEAWVKIPSTRSTQTVMVDWGDMALGHRFTLNIINGIPRIEVGGSGLNALGAISTGVWHHIAATYDSTANPAYRIYVDGLLSNSGNLVTQINTSNVADIIIGRRNDLNGYFLGTIDEVRVWNYTKTAVEIATGMNSEICNSANGLVAYYKMNQGIANGNNTGLDSLVENSGKRTNGTLYGFALSGTVSNWTTGQTLTAGGTSSTINVTSCKTYLSPSGNFTWNFSGTYFDVIPNSSGCDSNITINLTIPLIDKGVTNASGVLSANQSNATYQWLDCNNNFALVAGATNRLFTPSTSGSYAVQINYNSCTDTSSCSVVNVGLENINAAGLITLYPNPFTSAFSIENNYFNDTYAIEVHDYLGKKVLEQNEINSKMHTVDLSTFKDGIYTIYLISKDKVYKKQLVKSK